MENKTFVDTSGFYAFLVRDDQAHRRACEILRRAAGKRGLFVTTDYVLDETATLLRARGQGRLLSPFFETIFASRVCSVEWMGPERFEVTRFFALQHDDKPWSFTDCFSFCVMRDLRLRKALTKDHHFEQAGFEALLA